MDCIVNLTQLVENAKKTALFDGDIVKRLIILRKLFI